MKKAAANYVSKNKEVYVSYRQTLHQGTRKQATYITTRFFIGKCTHDDAEPKGSHCKAQTSHHNDYIAPIQKVVGGFDEEPNKEDSVVGEQKVTIDTDTRPMWEKLKVESDSKEQQEWQHVQEKVEDLNVRFARHFEDTNDNTGWNPPMAKSPLQFTKEELMRHQLTHTLYAPWCRHCISSRAVRGNHQRAGIRAKLVPDVDKDTSGSIKISMDYMYMHDRFGKYNDNKWNPPYLVVVEHKHGRVWV